MNDNGDTHSATHSDVWVLAAKKEADRLGDITSGRQNDETTLNFLRRIDQGFDQLDTDFANRLDDFHRGERAAVLEQYATEGQRQIEARFQPSLDQTIDQIFKSGGLYAREEEKRLFLARLPDDPLMKAKAQRLLDTQTARYTAVSTEIGKAHDDCLQKHDLNWQEIEAAQEPKVPVNREHPFRRIVRSRGHDRDR